MQQVFNFFLNRRKCSRKTTKGQLKVSYVGYYISTKGLCILYIFGGIYLCPNVLDIPTFNTQHTFKSMCRFIKYEGPWYRGSPDSTVFALPGNRTIEKGD